MHTKKRLFFGQALFARSMSCSREIATTSSDLSDLLVVFGDIVVYKYGIAVNYNSFWKCHNSMAGRATAVVLVPSGFVWFLWAASIVCQVRDGVCQECVVIKPVA